MMTDNGTADPAKASKLAQQIVALLINEEPVTRQRAIQAAMLLLGDAVSPPSDQIDGRRQVDDNVDVAAFFSRDGDMKPADYAHLCAAYHFSLYGSASFSTFELKAIAADAGVVIPDRLDKTLSQAAKKGKKLFQNAGKGCFKPTATGGLVFGERWGVKPGRKAKPSSVSNGATDAQTR